MSGPSLSLTDSLKLLRSASRGGDLDPSDARSLIAPVTAMVNKYGDPVSSEVAHAIISNELGVLEWPPLDGLRLIKAFLGGSSRIDVLGVALDYIALYFQELDGVVEECRESLAADVSPAQVSQRIVAAIDGVEGV